MSFILDALKKSEHNRRAQASGEAVTLVDVNEKKPAVRRQALLILMVFLLLGILLLLGVLVWQRPWGGQNHSALPVAPVADRSTAVSAVQSPAAVPVQAPQPQVDIAPLLPPPAAEAGEDVVVAPPPVSVVVQSTSAPAAAPAAGPVAAAAPQRSEDQIYSISELPADVRRRLPALQMALHAYNAADAEASLVQINGRLVRAGAQLAENLSVDEITSDGAVLRTGLYRFLLPRRGQ